MLQLLAVVLLLSLSSVGCALPLSIGGRPVVDSAKTQQIETGTFWIRVKWPTRELPGFEAKAIPLRTNSIRLITKNSQDSKVNETVLQRAPGVSEVSTASITLQAGTGYSIKAEAFEVANPGPTSEPIAQGNATNLTIRKSRVTVVPITLTAAYAPVITNLSRTNGPYGTSIAITGTNFGATPNFGCYVTIGGVQVSAIRVSDTLINATVTSGAVTGNVVVYVDGVPSTSVALFTVTQGLDATIVPIEDSYGDNGFDTTIDSSTTEQGWDLTIEGLDVPVTDQGLDVTIQ